MLLYMNSFFVGDNKLKPSFLVEIMTKQKNKPQEKAPEGL